MKNLIPLLTCFLVSVFNTAIAQYSTDWIRSADNYQKTGTTIARDTSDNVIVAGYIQSNNIYTRKYNKFGVLQWEKTSTSGIASNYEKAVWVTTDKNNNVFVIGYRYANSSRREYPNAVVVLKYNATGLLQWKNSLPVSVLVGSFSNGLNVRGEVDNNGNLYVGTAAANPSGFTLYKFNSAGTLLFTRSNTANAPRSFSALRLKGNKVVLTGSSGNLSAAPVIAWDLNGNLLWTASFTGRGGADVEVDGSGNVYLLSSYANQVTAISGEDMLIYKLSATGTLLWTKKYDFGGQDYPARLTSVLNKISIIGYGSINASYFDWITFQVSTGGSLLWNARYNGTPGNDELPAFIAAKANGEVFVTGKGGPEVISATGSSFLRFITLKYSNTGTTKWVDSVNIYGGFGVSCTLAKDSSLFVLSQANMTAYHFLDQAATGTCNIPTGLTAVTVAANSATFSWSAVPGANLYHLRYKTATTSNWTVLSTASTSINLTGLTAGTLYNYAVETVCSSGPSGYGTTQTITTTGTGYCTSNGQSTAQEYLNLVWLNGSIQFNTNNNGYGDYTNITFPMAQGSYINGYLSGLVPYPEFENYYIWIDYNHDNDFNDPGELVFNTYTDFSGYIAVNFTVPTSAALGSTRMRIIMKSGNPPIPCGSYPRGETEDYTVLIGPPAATKGNIPEENIIANVAFPVLKIFPNPFADKISIRLPVMNMSSIATVFDAAGKSFGSFRLSNLQNEIDLSTLRTGIYFIKIIQNNRVIHTSRIIKAR